MGEVIANCGGKSKKLAQAFSGRSMLGGSVECNGMVLVNGKDQASKHERHESPEQASNKQATPEEGIDRPQPMSLTERRGRGLSSRDR